MSDDVVRQESREERPQQRPTAEPSEGGGFALRLYKPGQGYYTRIGTAIGIGILAVWGAYALMNQIENSGLSGPYRLPIQYGVPAGFIIAMGVLVYWLTGLSRKANDFFIATEGEMKKVRWSTRKELTRSTKVVIFTVVVLGAFLFVWDIVFMLIFEAIGVLKGVPTLARLFGSGS